MRTIFKHLFFWLLISFWTSTVYISKEGEGWEFIQFNLVRLPLIMTATYLVVYYLLPKYILQKRQYFKFGVAFTMLFIITTLLDRWLIGSAFIAHLLKDTGLTYTFFNEIPLIRNAFLLLSIIGIATAIRLFNFYQQIETSPISISEKTTIAGHKQVAISPIKQESSQEDFLLKSGAITHKLNWKDILFLEKDENYVVYHTKEKRILERTTLSKLSSKLPDYFCRTHRSFIVSLRHIEQIERDFLMVHGRKVSIGRTYRASFLEAFAVLERGNI